LTEKKSIIIFIRIQNRQITLSSKTGFVYNEYFLQHDTGPGHPESPERLIAIVSHLQQTKLWQKLQHLIIDEAQEEWITKVHTPEHLKYLRQACKQGLQTVDQGDTRISEDSYNVALMAVGGVLTATDSVMSGILKNAFCSVRPPGHHAERDKPMGFCLLNNVAIAARYVQQKYGAQRVAIIDWDVHHGNGTQNIFYDDNSVLYISLHQFPFYPGTGSRGEQGIGKGLGFTINIPLMAGSGEKAFMEAFSEEVLPSLDNFLPDIIFISAGFDAHKDDPLANLNLTDNSFKILTSTLTDKAEKICNGRIVSVLEGGYNLRALPFSVEAHLLALIGQNNSH
jgi:acetoin utilization deacetylase AcuC-like enzyme